MSLPRDAEPKAHVGNLDSERRRDLLRRAWERLDPRFRTDRQVLGRRSTIGCVALEITQRCNLRCTACYLSENSESVTDIPLDVLFQRIDEIRETFGPGTGVQVTGGDPTLRHRPDLVAIVRRLAEAGLRPALFTNGIRASRDLLEELASAGLFDVAFHVDTTQQRAGVRSEADLRPIREEYIKRARGLGIAVIFNTTVHDGNLHEVPDLARFFVSRSDVVGMASFQLHAVTGRGSICARQAVSMDGVKGLLEEGIGAQDLAWDGALIGHPSCHVAAMLATSGGHVFDVLHDRPLFARFLSDFRHMSFDRRNVRATAREVICIAFRNPYYLAKGGAYLLKALWALRRGLLATGGKTGKITFFIQNFQDAKALDPERIANCSFMVMTGRGPVSMCEHNALRDEFILGPPERSTFLPSILPVRQVPPPVPAALPVHPSLGGK